MYRLIAVALAVVALAAPARACDFVQSVSVQPQAVYGQPPILQSYAAPVLSFSSVYSPLEVQSVFAPVVVRQRAVVVAQPVVVRQRAVVVRQRGVAVRAPFVRVRVR